MQRRRAVSLAEVLVASSLSLLLLGLMLWIYQAVQRTWHHGDLRQQAVREALIISARLRQDYRSSRPGSVQLASSGSDWLLSFPSYEGTGPEVGNLWNELGQVLWRKWVQYRFSGASQSLFRRELARTTPGPRVNEAPPPWGVDPPGHLLSNHLSECRLTIQQSRLEMNGIVRLGTSHSPVILRLYSQLYGLDLI